MNTADRQRRSRNNSDTRATGARDGRQCQQPTGTGQRRTSSPRARPWQRGGARKSAAHSRRNHSGLAASARRPPMGTGGAGRAAARWEQTRTEQGGRSAGGHDHSAGPSGTTRISGPRRERDRRQSRHLAGAGRHCPSPPRARPRRRGCNRNNAASSRRQHPKFRCVGRSRPVAHGPCAGPGQRSLGLGRYSTLRRQRGTVHPRPASSLDSANRRLNVDYILTGRGRTKISQRCRMSQHIETVFGTHPPTAENGCQSGLMRYAQATSLQPEDNVDGVGGDRRQIRRQALRSRLAQRRHAKSSSGPWFCPDPKSSTSTCDQERECWASAAGEDD